MFSKFIISFKRPSVDLMYTTWSYIGTCILLHLLLIKLHYFSRSSSPIRMASCTYIHACVVMLIYDSNSGYFWENTLIYWLRMVSVFLTIFFIIASLIILLSQTITCSWPSLNMIYLSEYGKLEDMFLFYWFFVPLCDIQYVGHTVYNFSSSWSTILGTPCAADVVDPDLS